MVARQIFQSFYFVALSEQGKIGIKSNSLWCGEFQDLLWLGCQFAGCLCLGAAGDRLRSSQRSQAPRLSRP